MSARNNSILCFKCASRTVEVLNQGERHNYGEQRALSRRNEEFLFSKEIYLPLLLYACHKNTLGHGHKTGIEN